MAKARILHSNVVLEAATTLVASASATGYAVTNLKNPHKRTLVWRSSTTTGDQTVTASFSARTIKAVALVNWLIHAGGSVKVEYRNGGAYAAFGGGSGVFTIPDPARTRVTALYDTAGVTATDIRITFTNTAAVSAYVELGVLVIADSAGYLASTVNVSDPFGHDQVDPSEARAALGGQEWFNERPNYLEFSLGYRWLPAAQKDALIAIYDDHGRRLPVVFAVDPSSPNLTVYGRFAGKLGVDHVTRDQWHVDVPIREVR